MAPDEYTHALDKALSDLEKSIHSRHLLNAEVAGLRATVRVLATRVPMDSAKQRQVAQLLAMADNATPNLTDAIRSLLTSALPKEMTAIEVRNALEDSSNMDDSNISLSACHAALKRMLADNEVELGPPKDGKASYRRVLETPLFGLLAGLAGEPPNLGDSPLYRLIVSQNASADRVASTLPPPPQFDRIEDALRDTFKKKK